MDLNVAVPSSGFAGSAQTTTKGTATWENVKILASPIGSESSGVSSLDSEEIKIKPTSPKKPETIKQCMRIYFNGRDILDLYDNIRTDSVSWKFRYSHLPEKDNIEMFWANRALYNRLGPNGLTPSYIINKCECCDFQYTSDCCSSYFNEASLNLSPTTQSSNMLSNNLTKSDIYTSRRSANKLPIFNQSANTYKGNLEHIQNKISTLNNLNKLKCTESVLKKNNQLNNINSYNNHAIAVTAANEVCNVAVNATNTSPNIITNYGTGFQQNIYNELITNKSQNSNTTFTTNQMASSQIFNNVLSHGNQNTISNLNLTSTNNVNSKNNMYSSNNMYTLFNSNTNNCAIYAINGSNNHNSNNQSFSSIHANNVNANPVSISQEYGKMYKYF